MDNKINLNDLQTAFIYKRTRELKFTYYIFSLLQNPRLVKILSSLAEGILKYNIPLKLFIKKSIFKVFCSGENSDEAFLTIKKLEAYKVKSVLDYVSEAEKTENIFCNNKEIILQNIIKLNLEAPNNSISIKLSGLEDPEFFARINNVKISRKTDDEYRYVKLLKRLDSICELAEKNKVSIYIDAEDHNTQDIFDHLVGLMMEKYNKTEAIVYNTLQMYLTDRITYLEKIIAHASEKHYFPGIKLVRGAYFEKERVAAQLAGIESPVYKTKKETDASFNRALEMCLKHHKIIYTCIASHNEESTLLAIDLIDKYDITDHFKKVKFSQLYGMSDNLTFNLASNGYNASKYLPYGEVKKAIPYLIRRAEENSSINGQITSEVNRLKKEIERRKLLGKE
ncbi:MAG: proline dehydrogenase family protein [Crocinitomicaceae bacterium]